MPNGRLSSRRGVQQLPRSSGRCSSRSSALRFPPSFFHSLRHTCPQCNLVHRGFWVKYIVPDSIRTDVWKNTYTCAADWFIKTFLKFQKQVPTRLTYNCAHLRSTKESLTFEYFETGRCWLVMSQYNLVLFGMRWYWVSVGLLCRYILKNRRFSRVWGWDEQKVPLRSIFQSP